MTGGVSPLPYSAIGRHHIILSILRTTAFRCTIFRNQALFLYQTHLADNSVPLYHIPQSGTISLSNSSCGQQRSAVPYSAIRHYFSIKLILRTTAFCCTIFRNQALFLYQTHLADNHFLLLMSFRPSDSEWRNLFLITALLIDFSASHTFVCFGRNDRGGLSTTPQMRNMTFAPRELSAARKKQGKRVHFVAIPRKFWYTFIRGTINIGQKANIFAPLTFAIILKGEFIYGTYQEQESTRLR